MSSTGPLDTDPGARRNAAYAIQLQVQLHQFALERSLTSAEMVSLLAGAHDSWSRIAREEAGGAGRADARRGDAAGGDAPAAR
jgi:hypothetical protein